MKTFGVIEKVYETGCNSIGLKIKEVSEEEARADTSDKVLLDFLQNAAPGDYLNYRWPIFRIR